MKCPFCREGDFAVIDSRQRDGAFPVRRRRACDQCKRKVWTVERLEEVPLKVVKKSDQRREPYETDKLRRGLVQACYKRPVALAEIDAVVRKIEGEIFAQHYDEVPASVIGDLAMEYLQQLDQVAYIRFASVYREFKDVSDFVDQVQPMLRQRGQKPARAAKNADAQKLTY